MMRTFPSSWVDNLYAGPMPEALDLVQLRTFLAIADCGGFGRAAAALHLSQPTVSQHVRQLERRLRQPLVRKAGRRTEFTDAGEQLLLEARHLLAVHDQAMARLDASSRTKLIIGATETAAHQILPGLLHALRGAYVDQSVQFSIDRSTQLTEAVTRGSVDLAILLGLNGDTPGRQVGALALRWFAAPEWTPPRPGDPLPLVAYVEPCGMRQRALTELSDAHRLVEVVAESTSLEGVIAAARAGLGVAVLPTSGPVPTGLVIHEGLPELGLIGVYLAARRGLDVDHEEAGLAALERFFDQLERDEPFGPARDHVRPSSVPSGTSRDSS
jgi:DNA-binding transcriptional LysR family regulator